ncbi:hypothetical protein HY479_02140 [Candidatus Uhrbacteria bacterium]|nr:hypothetical protein [Candidatus Uhrbacteria bacterium]
MPRTFSPAWIRIAGNAMNIRAGKDSRWRCYVNHEPPILPLERWELVGFATPTNVVPGTNPTGDRLGLNAWIDVFGALTISDDGVASIQLMDPEKYRHS